MAIKRQAARNKESAGEYVANTFLSLLDSDEESTEGYIRSADRAH
jgi:hypothetical protein